MLESVNREVEFFSPLKVNIQHKSWVCFLGKGFSFAASSRMVIADKKPQNILGFVQISICDFECYSKLSNP